MEEGLVEAPSSSLEPETGRSVEVRAVLSTGHIAGTSLSAKLSVLMESANGDLPAKTPVPPRDWGTSLSMGPKSDCGTQGRATLDTRAAGESCIRCEGLASEVGAAKDTVGAEERRRRCTVASWMLTARDLEALRRRSNASRRFSCNFRRSSASATPTS